MNLYLLLITSLLDTTKLIPLQGRLVAQKSCSIQSKNNNSKQQKLKHLWTDHENHNIVICESVKE